MRKQTLTLVVDNPRAGFRADVHHSTIDDTDNVTRGMSACHYKKNVSLSYSHVTHKTPLEAISDGWTLVSVINVVSGDAIWFFTRDVIETPYRS